MNFKLINKYDESDINFNRLFRYYILNHLNYKPFLLLIIQKFTEIKKT